MPKINKTYLRCYNKNYKIKKIVIKFYGFSLYYYSECNIKEEF